MITITGTPYKKTEFGQVLKVRTDLETAKDADGNERPTGRNVDVLRFVSDEVICYGIGEVNNNGAYGPSVQVVFKHPDHCGRNDPSLWVWFNGQKVDFVQGEDAILKQGTIVQIVTNYKERGVDANGRAMQPSYGLRDIYPVIG
jgi:hypothetical protein